MTSKVRQRRGANKKEQKKNDDHVDSPPRPERPIAPPQDEETAWHVFKSHPLVKSTPVILTAYALYLAFYYFQLQHPGLIQTATFGMMKLRPPVSRADERQVLIVGSMSSGLEETAFELRKQLKLEIGYEASDAAWNFVRDGTVSWFAGIRFLETLDVEDLLQRWSELAGARYIGGMGFHPSTYNYSACFPKGWSKCWSKQAFEILRQEWGCAADCEPPFRSTLFQVRHPLRTMESILSKVCSEREINGMAHSAFTTYASTLFPNHNFTQYSCIEATAYYLIEYNEAMLKAHSMGLIAGIYKIEDTSVCDIARMAGLMDPGSIVYEPNYGRVTNKLCQGPSNGAATQVVALGKHDYNKSEQLTLRWEDLHGGMHGSRRQEGDKNLEQQVKELTRSLGYDLEHSNSESEVI